MKYLLMIYGNREKWESIPPADWPAAIAKQDAFNARYHETGELLGISTGNPGRGVPQAIPVRVFAQRQQNLPDRALNPRQVEFLAQWSSPSEPLSAGPPPNGLPPPSGPSLVTVTADEPSGTSSTLTSRTPSSLANSSVTARTQCSQVIPVT